MAQAIVIEQYGGPEVLRLKDVEVGEPGTGQVRVRQTKIGVNFHDIYIRSGLYKTLALPGTPGVEAAGVIDAVGHGVEHLRVGDRVAYITGSYGVYASALLIDAAWVTRLPDTVSDTTAASALLRALTVEMLLNQVHQVRRGTSVLVQAAAGGVGLMLCQWASHVGATVIGTARTDAQIELAKAAGCHHVIRYVSESVPHRVMELTGGRGVDVAYDGVGKQTFSGSLASLAFCGHLVNYGQASGAIPPFEVSALAARSTSVSRPIIFHYCREATKRQEMVKRVFDALSEGWLKVAAPREFPLSKADESHRVLEEQGASVPLLLVPSQ
jgi:NADPH:quinone reductase-like Zn-dependent oxidoreductase